MKRTRRVFYMAVTPDKYELPLFFPETIEELCERYGVSKNTIYSSVCKNKSGVRLGRKFVRVELREE